MPQNDRLVWIDLEMTGLSTENDEIVEIAAIVTEADLTEIDEGVSFVVKPGEAALAQMDGFVTNMHTESGLITEIPNGLSLADAQGKVLAYIKEHLPEEGKGQLAGSSVYVDRGFLAKYMPEIDQYLHYRLIDVSSIKELARRWYPKVYFNTPEKPATIAPWPTSANQLLNCATTAMPYSLTSPVPTATPPRPSVQLT